MTTKTIGEAESAALLDLQWVIDEGIAEKINVSGRATGHNKFSIRVEIRASGTSIYENTFSLFWKVGMYGNSI